MTLLDSLLNRLTMYRLMLYYLIILVIFGTIFNGVDVAFETIFLFLICYVTNKLFAKIFKAPSNFESFAITALILSLIVGPFTPRSLGEVGLLTLTATLAMASKYLLVRNKRHLFNPAAIAVVLTAIFLHQNASWWVGTDTMTLPIILGGLLVLKKIRRFTLVIVFLATHLLLNFSFLTLPSSLLFFMFVMLPEPATSPVETKWQILYAAAVALLFKFLPVSFPLELSLLLGNLLSYLLSPTGRFILSLEHKVQLSANTVAFLFKPTQKLNFLAGQYLELTLPHQNPDSRGVRRFFTIASSPTEPEIMIVSRFVDAGSSFKKTLVSASEKTTIFANGPSGEFTLPKDPHQKLAFIAGGIGITPFRSMAKFLADTKESRNVVLLYAAATETDFLFKDLFTKAVYKVGRLEVDDIKKGVPDYKDRLFYVSGPEPMVQATEKLLHQIGVSRWQIKRDYFPGYED